MHIQLIILLSLFAGNVFAVDDKSMQELFARYNAVMDMKKVELIDEVFTERFIKGSGGKDELIEKIKDLPTPANKSLLPKLKMSWKKGVKGGVYLAKVKEASLEKSKKSEVHETEFIVVKEDGKLKIDGTLSDGN